MGEYFYLIGVLLLLYNAALIYIGEQPEFKIDEDFDENDIDELIKHIKIVSKQCCILFIKVIFELTQFIFICFGVYHMISSCIGNTTNTCILLFSIVALNLAGIHYKRNNKRYYCLEHFCYILGIWLIMSWCYNFC